MNQGSKKILISDYSKANKSMYSDLLTKNGFQVVTTFSHEDTIKNLREDNLDLLIIIDDTILTARTAEFFKETLQIIEIPVLFLVTQIDTEFLKNTKSIQNHVYIIQHSENSFLVTLVEMAIKIFDLQTKQSHQEIKISEESYQMLVESSPESIFVHSREGNILYANSAGVRLIGAKSFLEIKDRKIFDFVHPFLKDSVKDRIEGLYDHKNVPSREERILKLDKTMIDVEISGIPISFDGLPAVQVIARDITERKQFEMLEHARNNVLDQLIAKKPLSFVLEEIIRGIELIYPEMKASILLLDSKSGLLRVGASPSLPDFFNKAMDGLSPGAEVGSCGTAAFLGEKVIVEDVMNHPYWRDYRELAAKANLKACWSEPFKDDTGKILGTFAAYYTEVRSPKKSEISIISEFSRITGLAVQNSKSEMERIRAEEEVKALLIEKEILLKEVHHRIKNNMASVSSLLSLQADYVDDPKTVKILEEAQNRILSMMLIYDKLYKSTDYKNISIQDYLYDLIDQIFYSFPGRNRTKIEKQIENFIINSKSLFSVGIIINELITNAFKYAFPDGREGTILISVKKLEGDKVELNVSDDGSGLPEGFSISNSKGFGLNLIKMLTQKKGSSFQILQRDGAFFKVVIEV
ncbi:MAG: PAS domain S-box protein [Leptospiraceae bacterium]|nr:PAS domain S-box protein [Leptospiraceae bacterium]